MTLSLTQPRQYQHLAGRRADAYRTTRRQRIFKNHGITVLYLYIKHNPNSNAIEYWQRINSVICLK